MTTSLGNIANSGLQASMTNMETIGNNISNVNTVGFKKSNVNFADIYSSGVANSGSGSGAGVQIQSISQDFSTGAIDLTNRGLDLCLNNNGFFVQKDPASGQMSYTRAGQLDMDLNGYFHSTNGRIQGYPAVNGKILSTGSLVDLQVSQAPLLATPTSNVSLALNLDAGASLPTNTTFSSTDPTSYNFRTDSTVYDSLGNSYDMSLFYIKTSDNNWATQIFMGDQNIGSGDMVFQGNGQLQSSTGLTNLSWSPTSGANSPQSLNINFANLTQAAGSSSVTSNVQDGYMAGVPTGFNIDNNGNINVAYSNGQTQLQGQIALATFMAPQGLEQIDNMSWLATQDSGNPVINPNSSSGAFTAGMLELSNVDLTEELINLMGAQHDFQANSQVLQTYNQVLQTIEKL